MESKLTQRFGTDLSKWTAQDLDDDNDDAAWKPDDPSSSALPTFRARPVRDPWAAPPPPSPKSTPLLHRTSVSSPTDRPKHSKATTTTTTPADHRTLPSPSPSQAFSAENISPSRFYIPQRAATKQQQYNAKSAVDRGFIFGTDSHHHKLTSEPEPVEETRAEEPTLAAIPSPKRMRQDQFDRHGGTHRGPATTKVPVLDDGAPMYLTIAQAEREYAKYVTGLLPPNHDAMASHGDVVTNAATMTKEADNIESNKTSWSDWGITSPILQRNLARMGCDWPLLPVQGQVAQAIQSHQDVLVGTATGSGKTLAFLVPLVQQLLCDNHDNATTTTTTTTTAAFCRILICAPGRELASQIVSVAADLVRDTTVDVALAIGGTPLARNVEMLRKKKPTIVVGTPGRLAELVVGAAAGEGKLSSFTGKLKASNVMALVLDECDALLDYPAHQEPTRALVAAVRKQRGAAKTLQSVLCSATATDLLATSKQQLTAHFLRPVFHQVMTDRHDHSMTQAGPTATTTTKTAAPLQVSRTVLHGVVHVPHKRFMLETVRRILHTEPLPQQVLMFVDNAHKVQVVVDKLADLNVVAAPLSGAGDKHERADVNRALRAGTVGLVVATELAARGLDAPLLTHVINVDLPTDAAHYAHRAGRCGRGRERPGVVINLTSSPAERSVPAKLAEQLGIDLHTVEVRTGRLNVVKELHADGAD